MSPVAEVWTALPLPALLVAEDNCIAALNPAAEAFFNAPEKQVQRKPLRVFLRSDDDLNAMMARVRQGGSTLSMRDVALRPPGRPPLRADLQFAPMTGVESGLLILIQPLHLAGHLGRAMAVEDAAKSAVGMAEMLAHEIKNPLAGISGAAQLLSMSLGAEDREMTDLILQECRRVVDLLGQVEQFGDLRPPEDKLLNIHDILERARRSAELGTASAMVFRDHYDPSLPRITGDGDQLLQVFANLFANAAEAAGPNGGTITIRTFYEVGLKLGHGRTGQAVPLQIEVEDDGPGISASLRDRIFDPFVSGHENGTGLGLALVSKIISAHNGTILVSSEPGKTRFRISLPMVDGKDRG